MVVLLFCCKSNGWKEKKGNLWSTPEFVFLASYYAIPDTQHRSWLIAGIWYLAVGVTVDKWEKCHSRAGSWVPAFVFLSEKGTKLSLWKLCLSWFWPQRLEVSLKFPFFVLRTVMSLWFMNYSDPCRICLYFWTYSFSLGHESYTHTAPFIRQLNLYLS